MDGMTIDELARAAGVTTRSIRAYQTSGLLPHPRLAGRVGVYDEGHLARLRYIAHLQDRGFSLAAIRDLLTAWEEGRSLSDVLGFEDALTAPWTDEAPGRVDADELRGLFPSVDDVAGFLRRAVDVGLLEPEGDGWRVRSPTLLRVGSELVAAGLPLAAVLDEHVLLSSDMGRIAERFVALFEHHVWEPFVMAGMPADRLAEITEALVRVRPAAAAAVKAAFGHAMEAAVAASTSRQIARLSATTPPSEEQREAL